MQLPVCQSTELHTCISVYFPGNWIYSFSNLIQWRHRNHSWSPDFSWITSPAKYHLFNVIEIKLFKSRQEMQSKHKGRHIEASLEDIDLLFRILVVLQECDISLTKGKTCVFPKEDSNIHLYDLSFPPFLMIVSCTSKQYLRKDKSNSTWNQLPLWFLMWSYLKICLQLQ